VSAAYGSFGTSSLTVDATAAPVRLEVMGVRHRYASLEHDTPGAVSFTLMPGDRALLTGPNGSGKSAPLRRIVGLLAGPGDVRVDDTPVTARNLSVLRRRIGFLWQNPDDALLLPTVSDDVAFGPLNDGQGLDAARAASVHWLERLGIAHLAERQVRDLSLGEKQLVSLAGVLARRPGLLLLDEPTSFLDVQAQNRLQAIVHSLPTTMLLVSHQPEAWLATDAGWSVAAALADPSR
jgi:cobalt/nickel transport system ATP-binding protein